MHAPERFETERLLLRRPVAADAEDIFGRYSSDGEVTRYLAWPTHLSIAQTHGFLAYSESQWRQFHCGPYLIFLRASPTLLGSIGIELKSKELAETGYALARDAWGQGFATEALGAIVTICTAMGLRSIATFCHRDHHASQRVLAKQGFIRLEGVDSAHDFPNLEVGGMHPTFAYRKMLA